MLVYLGNIEKENQNEFEIVVRQICKDCKIANPNWLMIIMYAESNLRLVSNSIGAYGYIQITPSTALGLGISITELRKLSWKGYMQYAKAYIQERIKDANGVAPSSAYELYELIHYPISYRKPDSYVLYSEGSNAYSGNKALDYNKDGKVINAEVKQFIDSKCPILYDKSMLLKPEDSNNYYYQNYQVGNIIVSVSIVVLLFVGMQIFKKRNFKIKKQ
ncbi:hypothetical protein VB776_06845 [Arcicella sp. DC2W]|uniref:Transglycosylase SLT domain-containing protein n=1 Tax=Arcicella gelida TaxID=2984195 RepID=A0ABU5S2J1_9BACT|nr:hypothetical protein [Arcicella sp. DC2W]MEA5402624.1 hypothetical protein [Arcicella sp. DC2W]